MKNKEYVYNKKYDNLLLYLVYGVCYDFDKD